MLSRYRRRRNHLSVTYEASGESRMATTFAMFVGSGDGVGNRAHAWRDFGVVVDRAVPGVGTSPGRPRCSAPPRSPSMAICSVRDKSAAYEGP
jgi:hypothetical protein